MTAVIYSKINIKVEQESKQIKKVWGNYRLLKQELKSTGNVFISMFNGPTQGNEDVAIFNVVKKRVLLLESTSHKLCFQYQSQCNRGKILSGIRFFNLSVPSKQSEISISKEYFNRDCVKKCQTCVQAEGDLVLINIKKNRRYQ